MAFSSRHILPALFLGLLLWCGPSMAGQHVLVVHNSKEACIVATVGAFRNSAELETRVLFTAGKSRSAVLKEIRRQAPAQIAPVGFAAFYKVRPITDTPIIFSQVEDPRARLVGRKNITGVYIQIDPGKKLAALTDALPDVKCVGMFTTKSVEPMAREVKAALARAGVRLIERNVDDQPAAAVKRLLDEIKNDIDVFWMLPVDDVADDGPFERLLSASIGYFHILAFSGKYMKAGAFMAVYSDSGAMGAEAAEISNRIGRGENVENIQPLPPGKICSIINNDVVEAFEIKLAPGALKRVLSWSDEHTP